MRSIVDECRSVYNVRERNGMKEKRVSTGRFREVVDATLCCIDTNLYPFGADRRAAFLSAKKSLLFLSLSSRISLHFVSFPFGSRISCLNSLFLPSCTPWPSSKNRCITFCSPGARRLRDYQGCVLNLHHPFSTLSFSYLSPFFLSPIAESVISRFPVFVTQKVKDSLKCRAGNWSTWDCLFDV